MTKRRSNLSNDKFTTETGNRVPKEARETSACHDTNLDCFKPNAETLAAMTDAANGALVTTGSVKELMAELDQEI